MTEPQSHGPNQSANPDEPELPAEAKPGWQRRVYLGGGAVVVAVGIVAGAYVLSRTSGPGGPDPVIYSSGHNPFDEATGPSCVGMPLGSGAVCYSVDSSSALAHSFDAIREAVRRSMDTLSTRQSFGLVVWSEDGPTVVPIESNRPDQRERATEALDAAQPVGSTDAVEGVRAAVESGADVVCVIAAKGPTESDSKALIAIAMKEGVAIQCLAIRDDSPVLAEMAERTNGHYQRIAPQDLKMWLREAE